LIFVGGLVTSTGSGLSVPDWPLSYGMVMPPMVGGVFYEHGHRMVASFVGFLTLVLAVWTARSETRRACAAWPGSPWPLMAQGVLGGLTVLFLLPTPISVTHACLAQAFFCITIALAYLTSREWLSSAGTRDDVAGVRGAAVAATAAAFGQARAGSGHAHIGAGLASRTSHGCSDDGSRPPGCSSKSRSPFTWLTAPARSSCWPSSCASPCAPPVTVTRASPAPPSWPWRWCFVQIALGALTVLTGKAVLPTTAQRGHGRRHPRPVLVRHPAHAPAPPRGRVPARRRRPGRPRRVVSASASIVVPRRTAVADYLELTSPASR